MVLAVVCLGGCRQTPVDKQLERVETIREENAPEKLVKKGKDFLVLGDYRRAQQYFGSALDKGADPNEVLPLFLKTAVSQQEYRVALSYAEEYLREDPGNARLRFVVASLYLGVGDVPKALDNLNEVIARVPDDATAHYALAVLYRDEIDDPARADVHFREYLRLEPEGKHAREASASLLKSMP